MFCNRNQFHWKQFGCLVVLLWYFAALSLSSTATETIFLTAINDNMLPLSSSTMPKWIDGQIYVPYTTFDSGTTGLSLGTHATRNTQEGTVTVYSLANTLMFDLSAGHAMDQRTKLIYPYQAIAQNGVVYVPVAGVCNFFNLTYSYQTTDHGALLRLKGNAVVLSDSRFIDAANSLMASMVENYLISYVEPEVAPPQMTPEPEPEDEEEEELEEIPETFFCLGIDMIDYNVALPSTLSQQGIYVVYFFSVEQLETQGALVRELLGYGHSIGLKVNGDTSSSLMEQIHRGNTLLFQQTRNITAIIQCDPQWYSTLQTEGYLPWLGGTAQVLVSASSVLSTLSQGDTTQYLTLEQTEHTMANWSAFVTLFRSNGFIPLLPLESFLGNTSQ